MQTSQAPVSTSSSLHPLLSRLVNPNWLPPATSHSLSLSMSVRPVSAHLVQQIQAGSYVEMRNLLRDNMTVRSHYEELQSGLGMHLLPASSRPRVREINSLPSWICCFLTYLAVQTSDPVTRDRATYALLIVREAMRHGGMGWLDYDRLFRQQAAIDQSIQWNRLHPDLHATTILSQRTSTGSFCTLCQECDHNAPSCALAQLQPQVIRPPSRQPSRSLGRICTSWNDGACIFPGSCSYRHVCSSCFSSSHRAGDCRSSRSRPGGRSYHPLPQAARPPHTSS